MTMILSRTVVAAALTAAALLWSPGAVTAQDEHPQYHFYAAEDFGTDPTQVTFTRTSRRSSSGAACSATAGAERLPFSFASYQEVRRYAHRIKEKTAIRDRMGAMPPWCAEKDIGIQHYLQDPSLTDEELALIQAWVVPGLSLAMAAIVALPQPSGSTELPHGQASDPGVALTGHWAFRWTHMYEDGSRLVGGGLGILVNDRSRVELVGFGTAEPSRYSTLAFRLAYGGVQVQHELLRRGRLAVGTGATVAFGTFTVEDTGADTEQSTGVWLAEPELFIGVHVSEHLRLAAGGSYRWVWGVEGDIPNRSDGDARGPSVTLRLGVK